MQAAAVWWHNYRPRQFDYSIIHFFKRLNTLDNSPQTNLWFQDGKKPKLVCHKLSYIICMRFVQPHQSRERQDGLAERLPHQKDQTKARGPSVKFLVRGKLFHNFPICCLQHNYFLSAVLVTLDKTGSTEQGNERRLQIHYWKFKPMLCSLSHLTPPTKGLLKGDHNPAVSKRPKRI